jgi:oligoribonuclease
VADATDKPTKLIWLDIETTGLSPVHDEILEVAAFEADFATPFEARKLYEAVLWPERDLATLNDFVREMHTKNGLIEACWGAEINVQDAENELLKLIPAGFEYILAGSSVHFDHSFIQLHMTRLNTRFSHRHYDVSAVKLFAQSLGMPKFPKGDGAHRAAADVLMSIEHAGVCAAWFAARGAGNANGMDKLDAARWRALVRFWTESDNPTDIANSIPDLLGADADQLEEGVLK